MDIGINEVKEMIESLEINGELSIKEEKYLKVAKLCVQLAADNVALKDINAWCKTDAFKNMYREFKTAEALGCSDADCMHDAMLVAIMHAPATPATDRIVAGIKADAIDEAAVELDRVDTVASTRVIGFKLREFAQQLREGADK